ncbi:MAG TPA: hypothetical protein PKH07_10855 [bacterium]|nr:hypothetical protein [bacterium]
MSFKYLSLGILCVVLVCGCSKPKQPAQVAAEETPTAVVQPAVEVAQPTAFAKPVIRKVYDQKLEGICAPSEKELSQTDDIEGNIGVVDTSEIENWRDEYTVYFGLEQETESGVFEDCLQTMAWSYANIPQECPEMRASVGDSFLGTGKKYRWKAAVAVGSETPPKLISDWQFSDGFSVGQ